MTARTAMTTTLAKYEMRLKSVIAAEKFFVDPKCEPGELAFPHIENP